MLTAQVRMHNLRYGVILSRGSQKQKILFAFIPSSPEAASILSQDDGGTLDLPGSERYSPVS